MLAVILLVALTLRLVGIDWDGLYHLHPDERYIVWVGTTIEIPDSWETALDPELSTINPFRWPPDARSEGIIVEQGKVRSFAYGHWPLYLGVMTTHWLDSLGNAGWAEQVPADWTLVRDLLNLPGRIEYHHLTLVGRALAALFDTLTVLLVFALARRLYGDAAGLLAAALVALAVLHVQNAHFYVTDPFLAAAVTAAVYWMVRRAQGGRIRDTIVAGLFAGLAVGAKFSAIMLLFPLVVAVLVRHRPAGRAATDRDGRIGRLIRRAGPSLLEAVGALLVSVAVFAITNPFALLDQSCTARLSGGVVPIIGLRIPSITVGSCYLENIGTQNAMVRGSSRIPFTFQYIGTPPYLYFLDQMFRWGLGPAWTLIGLAGLAWGLGRVWQPGRRPAELVLLAWAVPFLLVTGSFQVKFLRYLLPLTPFLAVLAAGMLAGLGQVRSDKLAPVVRWFVGRSGRVVLGSLVVILSLLWSVAFVSMYRVAEHPWVAASRWILSNVPAGSTLATEHWDHALPLSLRAEDWSGSTPRYWGKELVWYNVEDLGKLAEDRVKLEDAMLQVAGSDFVILASNRLYGVIPRLPERYPEAGVYYRLLFNGELGFELVHWSVRYPVLGPLALLDDPFSRPQLAAPVHLAEWRPDGLAWNLGTADESFTVYDHPLVLIFENRQQLTAEELVARVRSGAGGLVEGS